MSFSETIFLFFLALIIFGPKKLPEIARQVGKYLNEFRRASNEFKSQIEQEIAHLEREESNKKQNEILKPAEPPIGTASRTLEAESSEAATLASSGVSSGVHDSHSDTGATEALPTTEPLTSSTPQDSHA
ncbi:MAG TPA: twin-arginine translocase TatA/TatE family subunit [Candidatus Sulfotelmatobacter sp.]|nr:twin-arginine translocase TatA/TatE family subunit [Candidatus Sulfotelmatobacter sp.]